MPIFVPTFCRFRAINLPNANSTASGDGCTYRCETVTVECPIKRMIVNASAPASPAATKATGRINPVEEHKELFSSGLLFLEATNPVSTV
jgi:hypothetical protein